MVEPDKGPELSAYRETIQKAAQTHQWEFVIKYDRQFRKAAAVDRSKCWARVDSSLFMQELAGPQAAFLAAGAWTPGRGSEYSSSRKRSRNSGPGGDSGGPDGRKGPGTCHKFNWQDGVCPMGLGASSATRVPDAGGGGGGLHPSSRCNGPHMEWGGVVWLVGKGQARDKVLVINILGKGTELGREGVTELFGSLFHSTSVLIIETHTFTNRYWLAE